MKITCADFLRILKENPDKELEFGVRIFVPGEVSLGYHRTDTKKVTDIKVSDNKVTVISQ